MRRFATMEKDSRLEIRIPTYTKDRLAQLAKDKGVSMAEWIRGKVDKDFERKQKRL